MVRVNREKCIGCGNCEYLCPEVFALKEGKSSIKEGADTEKHRECIKKAIEACPTQAISED